jgi:hypothetical protein
MFESSCLAGLVVAVVLAGGDGPAVKTVSDDEVKWATRVAVDFFESLYRVDPSCFGLLSPELAKAYSTPHEVYNQFWAFSRPTLKTHRVSPSRGSRGEVIFSTILKGWRSDFPDADLLLRVAKESNGRWSIRYIRVQERAMKDVREKSSAQEDETRTGSVGSP